MKFIRLYIKKGRLKVRKGEKKREMEKIWRLRIGKRCKQYGGVHRAYFV